MKQNVRSRHWAILAGWLLLLALNSQSHAATAKDYAAALQAWGRVLNTYVDEEGRTDFIALAQDRADLDQYVTVVAGYGPNANPGDFPTRESVLAYHANTYNALAMHGVIEEGIPENFDSFFKRARFFRFRGVQLDGEKTNLHDYENRVIRPLDEPRMHFALNCMVRDCPRLPRTPFPAEGLDEFLQKATVEFFNTPKHLRIDNEGKRIYVSAILDFYAEDFVDSGNARDLGNYINQYLPQPLPAAYDIGFIDYDWTINQQPGDARPKGR